MSDTGNGIDKGLKIGIVGLDTSHVTAFTEILNNKENPFHVEGGTIVAAYPGGSADFELSHSRVEGFTAKLRDDYGVEIVSSPEAVAELCDAILLESVDGRVHLEQFGRLAPYGKPVFVDKPFTVDSGEARQILALAAQHGIPLMSCSSLRYAEGLREAAADAEQGAIIGMDCYGPTNLVPTQPGLFWYGIHTVEMLFSVMGPDCVQATATKTDNHELVVGTWADGRIGTIRGNRSGNDRFGALIHRERGTTPVDVYSHPKPYYASMLEKIMTMFATGKPDIDSRETEQIIRFIEAANESRETGRPVRL